MKTKLFSLAALLIFAVSCTNQPAKKAETKTDEAAIIELTADEFVAHPENYVDKVVKIKGTPTHVCKHGGKKMFLACSDSLQMVKITAGEGIEQFDATCEGGDIVAEGVVKELRIDEEYLVKMEAEGDTEHSHGEGEGHGEGEEHKNDNNEEHLALMKKIEKYRAEIKEGGKDYVSRYWIESTKYEIITEEVENTEE